MAVRTHHQSTRLGGSDGESSCLAGEEILAGRLGLGEHVSLISVLNVQRSILGSGRENLEAPRSIEKLGASPLARCLLHSLDDDGVRNLSHLGSLVISNPSANRRRQT